MFHFESARQRVAAIIGLLIALGWPFRNLLFGKSTQHLESARSDIHTILIEWTVVAVLALIAFWLQRLDPAFFRFRTFRWRDLLYLLAALIAAVVLSGIVGAFVHAPKIDLRQLAAVPLSLRVGLVLTAAICEEFMYRGFAIEELGALTGSRWLGAWVSLALFGLGHFASYGFSTALLIPTSVGLMITLLYMFRNNLPLCMLMHGVMDTIFVVVLPELLRK